MIGVSGSCFRVTVPVDRSSPSSCVARRGTTLRCFTGVTPFRPTSLLLRPRVPLLPLEGAWGRGALCSSAAGLRLNRLNRLLEGFFEAASLTDRVTFFVRDLEREGSELNRAASSGSPGWLYCLAAAWLERSILSACASTNSASRRNASWERFSGCSLRTVPFGRVVRGGPSCRGPAMSGGTRERERFAIAVAVLELEEPWRR